MANSIARLGLAILVLALGCGGEDQPLPTDVSAVLSARCQRCHSDPPQNFAPMPLVSWDDLQRESSVAGETYAERLASRIQNVDFPMPPIREPENAAFTEAERNTLLGWVAAGSLPGSD